MGKLLILLLSTGIATIATVFFLPFYPELKPAASNLPPSPILKGPLARNSILDHGGKIWHHIEGPESIAVHDGWLITGAADGNIHRLKGNIDEILIDRKCDDVATCNRPLGVRVVNDSVYVADAVLGVYKVNIRNKNVETLFDAAVPVDDKLALFTDDLTVSRNGDIYFTDASTRWGLREIHFTVIDWTPDGRLLHYDPTTKTVRVLLDGLYFPNGIQLSPDEDYVVFSETIQFRLQRYYLKGPKKGQVEIFAEGLPGTPDNIRASGRGTYWVALYHSRFGGKKTIMDRLAAKPEVRGYITRLPYFFLLPLEVLDNLGVTKDAYSKAKRIVGHLLLNIESNDHRIVVEVDQKGNIIRSLHSTSGKVSEPTQVLEHESTLYISTLYKRGIWKVNL